MLAFAWRWADPPQDKESRLSARLGSSLCAGIGGHAGTAEVQGLHFAYRSLHSSLALSRAWRPTVLASGHIVVFHGYFDNAAEIADALSVRASDPALLYGLAVQQWVEEADRRIIGEYSVLIAEP